ncbi:hypothetical protein DIS18_11280 [Algibacter marinivivus]|uniref:Methyltransferase domain-containing protein n=1 Tax=Algibacter marinivivus TaxID=2100723 RepID=A0A2U2X4X9_9FLAO|nr:methyltransferase domain-containing protein [Algibacter marinivivus]PWH82804.1 hypothetical protein DIS18_11280 [Algibacter marinivivus]
MIKKILNKLGLIKKANYTLHGDFWQQEVNFKSIDDRFSFFETISKEKKVLHFGCTDWPIFDPSYNLHIKLAKVTKEINGFDIDEEGIANLKKYVDQPYYSTFESLKNKHFDVCLVPETIEHVDNVRTFLEGLSTVNADVFYITAPNCFAKVHMERNYYSKNKIIEVVHPDHNCWYSPFTLKNQIQKYSNLKVDEVFLLNNDTMVCCKATNKNIA